MMRHGLFPNDGCKALYSIINEKKSAQIPDDIMFIILWHTVDPARAVKAQKHYGDEFLFQNLSPPGGEHNNRTGWIQR
jgi:hypothetical protein